MSPLDAAREPVQAGLHDHDRVQPEKREVGEVVLRDRLAAQMRVDQAQTAKALHRAPATPKFGDEELVGVANEHPLDTATSVEQQAHLSAGLARELRHPSRELGADELFGRDATFRQRLQRAGMAVF